MFSWRRSQKSQTTNPDDRAPGAVPPSAADAAAVMRCECGDETRISFVSPACSSLTGIAPRDLAGQRVDVFRGRIHHDDRQGYVRELSNALRIDDSYSARYRFHRPDESTIVVSERGRIIRDTENQATAIEATLTDVTELNSLRRERNALFRLSGQIICIADFEGYIVDANPAVEQVLGWNSYEICARPFIEFVHPEDREQTLAEMAALRNGTPVQELHIRWRAKDGSYRTLCWDAQPLVDGMTVCAVARDETAASDAVRALERYRLMFEQSPEEFYLADMQGTINYCNPAAAESVGVRVQDMIGMNLFALNGSDPIAEKEDLLSILVHGESEAVETRHLHRNGKFVPKRLRFFLLRSEAGRFVCAVGYSIAEELREKEQLRESEMRFRMLAENARDVIYRYRIRPNAGFEYVNPAAERITGYSAEEHYADPLLGARLVHPDDRYLLQQLQSPDHSPYEPVTLRWIRKDGEVIWTEQFNRLITDRTGQVVAIEGIARDVSLRKKAEQEARLRSSALDDEIHMKQEKLWALMQELERLSGSEAGSEIGASGEIASNGQSESAEVNLEGQVIGEKHHA